MKIGIDARFLQGPRRGQGQYVYYLIKSLLEASGENECVAFYNGFRRGAFAFGKEVSGLKQVWCNIPGTLLGQTWSRMRFPPVEYLIGDVDVFHNPTNMNLTQYAPLPCRAPMVATFNGMADPSTVWETYDRKKVDRWFADVAERASMVIAVSKMVKDDLLRRVFIPEERIRVIPCGVSEEFSPVTDKKRLAEKLAKYGLAGKRYILYAGGAEPNKNLGALIEAFSLLSRKDGLRDRFLVLAGAIDDYYSRLAGKAEAFGVAGKVVLTGRVEHDDLPLIYNGADAFVLPTIVEWFGIPVLEAAACGVPVIASQNTGALEFVGDSAAVFDPKDTKAMADAIAAVLLNDGLRRSMIAKGSERVKLMSWQETARRTIEVYKEACGKGGRKDGGL